MSYVSLAIRALYITNTTFTDPSLRLEATVRSRTKYIGNTSMAFDVLAQSSHGARAYVA